MNIREWPHKSLRTVCREVQPDEWSAAISAAQACFQVLGYKYTNAQVGEIIGVGCAANQVGWDLRVFVVKPHGDDRKLQIVINPKILRHGREVVTDRELCLSHSGMIRNISRFAILEVEWWDEDRKHHEQRITDRYFSRIFQHESDHLLGVSCMYKPGLTCPAFDGPCITCQKRDWVGKPYTWEGADEAARGSIRGFFGRLFIGFRDWVLGGRGREVSRIEALQGALEAVS